MAKDIGLASCHGVFVWNADDFERRGQAGLCENSSTRLPQATINHVLLDRDDGATLGCCVENSTFIKGFYHRHADHAAFEPGCFRKKFGGEKRVNNGFPRGNECSVVARADNPCRADHKG